MNSKRHRSYIIYLLFLILQTGCIHEYPSGSGNDPNNPINANIEISFDLRWDNMLYEMKRDITRGREERPHRFIIEAAQNGVVVCRDTSYLASDDFANGIVRHKLSRPLRPQYYQLAVWYDVVPEGRGNSFFNAEDLTRLTVSSTSVMNSDSIQCAFGSVDFDLKEYKGKSGANVVMEVTLQHPGGKFEIIATDIQDFIANRREELFQGERYSLSLILNEGNPHSFNSYSGRVDYMSESLERRGAFSIPFGDYSELKIADGYVFCASEDIISMTLTLYNSSLMAVTKTDLFSFPVKRGFITRVKGDFLTHPIDGPVTIDPQWEGEIIVEL
ncbi:MAG: hypothetical protein J1E95_03815 [Muribaculaceae bacterium]|nr:hypothetical protein [Muribaculaceae bacterium]